MMHIRRLDATDAAAFQALRLSALLDTPEAFGASHEEELALTPAQVAERFAEAPAQGVFGAFDGQTLVGMAGLARDSAVIAKVTLNVDAANVAAIALYESLGFIVFGREADAMRIGDDVRNDLQMSLALG